jgi:hypothetical protein
VVPLCLNRLKALLSYDPDSGHFFWRESGGKRKIGVPAGCVDRQRGGYVLIGIDRSLHQAHRLAWLYMFGAFPCGHLDHINGDRGDNRIANLRECTRSQNQSNRARQSNNTSGFKGVVLHQGKWMARVTYRGKTHYFSGFDTAQEAAAAYDIAAVKIHGRFAKINGAEPWRAT